MTPMEATLQGAKEIGFTVFSISVSLIAVFIPLLLMGGIIGRLFREFAITLSSAILVSMVISLTTTPMMCSRVLVSEKGRSRTAGSTPGASASSTARSADTAAASPGCSIIPRCMLAHLPLHPRAEHLPDRENSQGLLPAAGHRSDVGRHAGAAGRLVLRHAKAVRAGDRHHQGRPRRAERDGIHRRPGRHQYRLHLHRPQAAQ